MNGLQSRSIDVMRFAMILLVVVLHAYTSTRSDFSAGDFSVYRLVSFVCSLEIAQTAVPALFFISGFLFFLHPKPYKTKLRKTSKRLIVPYLLWNALILALYFGVEQIPALSKYFSGVNPPVSGYSFVNFLQAFWDSGEWRGGNGTPILHQFWYIRNLILLALLSPAIRLFVCGFGWGGGRPAAAAVWLLCRWVGYDLQLRIGNKPVYEIANDDYTQIIDVPEDGLWQAVPLEAGQPPAVQHPRGAVPRRYGHGRSV